VNNLHKIERPKFERRGATVFSVLMRVSDDALGMMVPGERFDEPTNGVVAGEAAKR
jgi:hypothetical protein